MRPPSGALWFGCGEHVCRLEGGQRREFGPADGLPEDRNWRTFLQDPSGNLWIRGAQHLAVLMASGERFELRDRGLPPANHTFSSLLIDREGTLLASTDEGLAIRRAEGWQVLGQRNGLPSDLVVAALLDHEGSVWVGTRGGGLARWQGRGEWTNWDDTEGLPSNAIWALRRDQLGVFWVGTNDGLVRWVGNGRRVLTRADGLPGNKIKTFETATDGSLWVGLLPGGVVHLDAQGGVLRAFGAADGLTNSHVVAMSFDRTQRLWVSTFDGLFRATNAGPAPRFERQSMPGAKPNTAFYRSLVDRQGRLWAASGAGLYLLDGGALEPTHNA